MNKNTIQHNFEQLYLDYQLRLTAYARRFVCDPTEAQDLVHDCFMNLWNRHATLNSDEAPLLLFVMLRNRCLDYLKHKKNIDKYSLCYRSKIKGEERLYNYDFAYNDTEQSYLFHELESQIQTILDNLPDRCREVFVLSRFQGLKNREIAEQLQISEQAVEKHIQKALRVFTSTLQQNQSIYLQILILSWASSSI